MTNDKTASTVTCCGIPLPIEWVAAHVLTAHKDVCHENLNMIPAGIASKILDSQLPTEDGGERAPLAFDPAAVVRLAPLMEKGRRILRDGVPYVVQGMIPAYGGVGFVVARAKVGKTSTGLHLVSSVGSGREFLGCEVSKRKVLMLALEDPEDYLAVLAARAMKSDEDVTFYPRSLVLDDATLRDLGAYIEAEGFGFLYVATFLHAVRGLVKDENDNAGMVKVVASLKAFAREREIPTLIEAHAGKGEDQSQDADPLLSLRGASAAAAEADYVLSLKRKGAGFSTVRTLSGLGRFVEFQPITFDREADGELRVVDSGNGEAARETDFRFLVESGALAEQDGSAGAIAVAAGWAEPGRAVPKAVRVRVDRALRGRDEVATTTSGSGRSSRTLYRIALTGNGSALVN